MVGSRQKALLQGSVVLKCNMLRAKDGMWVKNRKKIEHSEHHVYRKEPIFGTQVMMLNLKIVNVTKNDEGLYMCLGYRGGITANKTFYLKTGLFDRIDIN